MVDATHEVGVGWGGDDNVLCTCTHGRCYATSCFLHVATQHHVLAGWGGMGWGGDDNVLCTCRHGRCYATSCFLHLHTWSVLRNIMFLARAHMVGGTQHHVSCTCTHGRCYATSCFLRGGVGWGGVGMITFFALADTVGATQHHVSCTCTHGRCYATSCFLSLKGVSHLRFVFTPLAVIPKKGLDQNSINLLRRLVGDEVCKERRDSYVLTAGDNCAESLCAVSKKQLRRTNLNIAVVRDKIEHRYLLSSHFLNKAPGLARIMQALRCHKLKCMSGLVSPTGAFKKPLWQL